MLWSRGWALWSGLVVEYWLEEVVDIILLRDNYALIQRNPGA